jgi:hypothetical protein
LREATDGSDDGAALPDDRGHEDTQPVTGNTTVLRARGDKIRQVGTSDTQFINEIIQASKQYDNNEIYFPFPDAFGLTYNSNSYVSGVLEAAGAHPPTLPKYAPGYSRPLNLTP